MTRESDRIETLRPVRSPDDAPEAGRPPITPPTRAPDHAPRGVGEIVDLGFEILRERFATVLFLCALLWFPLRALLPVIGTPAASPDDVFVLLAYAVWVAGSAVVQAFSTAIVALVVFAALRGETLGITSALRLALACVLGVLVISLASGIAAGAGTLLCLAPGIWLSFKLSLWPSAYVIERRSIGESLSRSLRLTTGSFGRWAGIMAVLIAVSAPLGGVSVVFDTPEASAAVIEELAIDPTLFQAIGVVVTSLFSGLATAVSALGLTVFYLDCRIRRDGLDLARRLESLRAASAPAVRGSAP